MDIATRTLLTAAGLLVFGAILTFLSTWFWWQRKIVAEKADKLAEENVKVLARLAELESKLALVNQAVVPISNAFQAILIKELTHYHTPELDALLQKIGPPNTLTPEEVERMTKLLEERTGDMGPEITEQEREAAHILPFIVRRAQTEADTLNSADVLKLKLVTVAAVIGVPTVTGLQPVKETPHGEY